MVIHKSDFDDSARAKVLRSTTSLGQIETIGQVSPRSSQATPDNGVGSHSMGPNRNAGPNFVGSAHTVAFGGTRKTNPFSTTRNTPGPADLGAPKERARSGTAPRRVPGPAEIGRAPRTGGPVAPVSPYMVQNQHSLPTRPGKTTRPAQSTRVTSVPKSIANQLQPTTKATKPQVQPTTPTQSTMPKIGIPTPPPAPKPATTPTPSPAPKTPAAQHNPFTPEFTPLPTTNIPPEFGTPVIMPASELFEEPTPAPYPKPTPKIFAKPTPKPASKPTSELFSEPTPASQPSTSQLLGAPALEESNILNPSLTTPDFAPLPKKAKKPRTHRVKPNSVIKSLNLKTKASQFSNQLQDSLKITQANIATKLGIAEKTQRAATKTSKSLQNLGKTAKKSETKIRKKYRTKEPIDALASELPADSYAPIAQRVVLSIIVILVLVVSGGIITLLNYDTKTQLETEINDLAETYYEDYFYPNVFSGNISMADVLAEFGESGLTEVTLRQLILNNPNLTTSDIHFLREHCDQETTTVRYYPVEPYSNTDYRTEFNYNCNFDDENLNSSSSTSSTSLSSTSSSNKSL